MELTLWAHAIYSNRHTHYTVLTIHRIPCIRFTRVRNIFSIVNLIIHTIVEQINIADSQPTLS